MIIPPLRMLVGHSAAAPEFYSSKVMSSDWDMVHSPSGIYVASLNKTFVTWCAVGRAGFKACQVAVFDHATDTWSRRYNAGNFNLPDDDHGHPAICRDADGYLYVFYGSHASTQVWSVSANPNDVTSWVQQVPLSGAQTYPHPVLVGSTIYLFVRNDSNLTRRTMVVRSATPAAGVASFSGNTTLVDFEADSRVYTSECYVFGTDVHFVCTLADEAADTNRRHVYYFVYKTSTGALENHDGSVSTASGSLPVTLTTANASYRIVDYGTDQGEVPSLAFDSSGNPHVQYIRGPSGGPHTLYHTAKISGSWTTPVALTSAIDDQIPGNTTGTGFIDMHGLVAGASDTVQAWYQNAAGDKLRRVRSASGVWSAEETVVAAGALRLGGQQSVRDAHPDLRTMFCEVTGYPSLDSTAAPGKRYGHGDSGLLPFVMPAAGSVDTSWPNVALMLGFEGRDGDTRPINEADQALLLSVTGGNAQVDTAQSKFGGASLLLDGTADFLEYAHDTLFSVANGDMTAESFVKRNASKLQCVASKYPSAGASEWRYFVNASNLVQLQVFRSAGTVVDITGATTITTGWHHIAVSRSGSTWRVFVDGTLDASGTESATPDSNTQQFTVGRDRSNAARDFNGWIDEFRFTAGVARYTASFTAPSAAFSRI